MTEDLALMQAAFNRLKELELMYGDAIPIEEQIRIVAKVDELEILCDTLLTKTSTAQTTQLNIADALTSKVI